jgi:polyvinyl alcohol dehydrogenase (cytochrome)
MQISAWSRALAIVLAASSEAIAQSPQESVFKDNCAVCHDNPATRAPARSSLHAMSPNFIVEALTSGIMTAQGSALSPEARVALAEYLTGRKVGAEATMAGKCEAAAPPLALDGLGYNGWGGGVANWRFQPQPGINAAQVSRLEVKWAFGFPGVVAAFAQPTIVDGLVFVGSQNRHVYALDAATGCYFWDYTASAGVRSAITVARIGGRDLAFFGDRAGHVYAVDAMSGQTVWKVKPDDEPAVQVTGAPTLFEGRLYVPISVGDDSAAIDPKFECCKGRGAVIALNAASGETLWSSYMLPGATPQGKNAIGTQLWGPSGASIWSSPTIDAKAGALYVGTGDNHSAPATETSDAIVALSLKDGSRLWSRQLLAGDMGNGSCLAADKTNCPEPHGPDFDIGDSPSLVSLPNGQRALLIGQKSGMMWALDPDAKGRIIWQTRVGNGGPLGGVQWGPATDGRIVYAPVSDLGVRNLVLGQPIVLDPGKGGGLHALDAATGAMVWTASPAAACGERPNCSPAQSQAATATPEFVLSGAVDGHIRAYATSDGRVLWDFDTVRAFKTVNGVDATGGSLDAGGPTVAGGMVLVGSGYGLYGGAPGNVLIAFAPRP